MRHYLLYNDDRAVASFGVEGGLVRCYTALEPDLLPMQIRAASPEGFTLWLRERAIDLNTLLHRNLVQHFYGTRDKLALCLLTHMFSISDTFTCFEEGAFQPRSSICTPDAQNEVSRFILLSSDTSLRQLRVPSPNVSTDGSFPKTWQYEAGAWWLYKLQSETASKCEVEISRVLEACGWDHAEYQYDTDCPHRVKSRNFLQEHEFFEPYASFAHCFTDVSDQAEVISKNIASLGSEFLLAWKRITLADAFFENTDRHTRNFGVIRSSVTGKVLRLAPNFDNNQAYTANPGGYYSGAMLASYMAEADEITRHQLFTLTEKAATHPFLAVAAKNGGRCLGR